MKPFIIAIVGPTAVGKTRAAIRVCQALGGEVVSMDSMQIYKGMDIGTAKPDVAEREGVPHHLLDIVSPADASFTVAQYREMAQEKIEQIRSRGALPVLSGGTGLYLNALTRPMNLAQADGNEALREEMRKLAETAQGRRALHARLEQVDPQSAARLHENDIRRVIRALEVYDATGKTMSEYHSEDNQGEGLYDACIYGLTMPREMLYARINARVDAMVRQGLVQEVRTLLESGLLPEKDGALQAIGYKEIVRYLRGEVSLLQATEEIKRNSRRYAKRQMTWLRRDERVRWYDVSTYDSFDSFTSDFIAQIRKDVENRRSVFP